MHSSGAKGISRIPKRMDGNKKSMKIPNETTLARTLSISGPSHAQDSTDKVIGSCVSLKESSLRKQLKAVIMSDCKFEPLFSTETLVKDGRTPNRSLPDPNKVNELDCLNNRNQSRPYPFTKTFFRQIMRSELKIANKRTAKKNFRERSTPTSSHTKRKIKKPLSDSEDETLRHIKYIANCLLENTLNKLDIKESSKLIADHIDDPVVNTPESGTSFCSDIQLMDAPTCSTDQQDSGSTEEGSIVSQDTMVDFAGKPMENNNSIASREALYDPNSRADLLEDFDMSPLLDGFESVHNVSISSPTNNVVLLGMRPLNDESSAHHRRSIFPGWLLRLLRNNVPIDNPGTNNEWAYFYSQGDGWANNTPWFIQNNNDENEDASSEASSSSSIAEGEDGSSFQDIISIPDDSRATNSSVNQEHRDYVRLQEKDSEEYFDTSDNLNVIP